MNKAAEILKMLPRNEATKGSKKIEKMFDWANSPEVEAADATDDAMSTVTDMAMFEIGHVTVDDLFEAFELGKKPQAEIYSDGDSVWICDDTQAMASKLQAIARKYKLKTPVF